MWIMTNAITAEDVPNPVPPTHGIPSPLILFPLEACSATISAKAFPPLPLVTSEEQLFRVSDRAVSFFEEHGNSGERFKFTLDRLERRIY